MEIAPAMAYENASEQQKPNEVQRAPQLAWQPSASDYQTFSTSTKQQHTDANQTMINGGIFNDVVIDFSSDPLLAQAVHYRDYPTTQPKESTQPSMFQEPFVSPNKLITGESNQPNTSQGLTNINDANHLVSGMAHEGLKMVNDLANFLSQPEVINKAIIGTGPVLDTAVNYYANNDAKTVRHDAGIFTAAGLNQVDKTIDKLSYPMDQNEIGKQSAAAMPFFIVGRAKPLTEAEVKAMKLETMTEAELQLNGFEQGSSFWGKLGRTTEESVDRKLQTYLLDPEHIDQTGRLTGKAKWFENNLGFTQSNADQLAAQIKFDPQTAQVTAMTEHGTKFIQDIEIHGTNGITKTVPFTWIQNPDGVVRLIGIAKFPPKPRF